MSKSWKATFNAIMKRHNGYNANGGKVVSYATQKQRQDVLLQGFRDLRSMGYKFTTVLAFRGKHMERLVRKWEEQGCSPSTIQNRVSIFRTFANWIGKKGMVLPAEKYVRSPKAVKRSYKATTPRSWVDQGVDPGQKIEAINRIYGRFAAALELQLVFGLRSKESLLLKPHLADKGHVLVVSHGTKGGRTRYIPIETKIQRELLDRLKANIKPGSSLVPKEKNYAQFRNQYYYVLRKHGISRKNGITPHGLRHAHLTELYEQTTGQKPPVSGGELRKTNKELDNFGRQIVSERAGHNRASISSAYLG